jgi:predicted Rossmann-fold nucleotide-binding protein
VLVGRDYWTPLVDWLRGTMLREGKINQTELDLFRVTDDPADAVSHCQEILGRKVADAPPPTTPKPGD